MRVVVLFSIASICLCVTARAEVMRRESATKGDTDDAPPPTRELMPNDPGYDKNRTIEGIEKLLKAGFLWSCPVLEVTMDSITVLSEDMSGWDIELPSGKRTWSSIPARRLKLSLSNALKGGKFGEDCLGGMCKGSAYPITMVEVGDRVRLRVVVEYDRYVCAGIQINRRPGGRVPRAPLDDFPEGTRHHEGMNALQDVEERGIPLPMKYDYLRSQLPPHLQNK